jgi:predicted 3-demethylubiquinone-9 3-methyltransferase (glyoxalase superfamily)
MQKISTFLWFDKEAEEAANFYVSIFKNSKVLGIMPGPNGTVLGVGFQLEGQEFKALNGGPQFKFTPAISLFVNCQSQAEVDELWQKLTSGGGKPNHCGWLTDKYGLSWQIVPAVMGELLGSKDRERAGKAMNAMMQMDKIDIAKLEAAYNA